MKITYKYSRNNAQFLYDLSSTSSIDQLVKRLTGRQIITNKDGEKEHVDPAFNVDEILINGVEVFNRTEDEAVYNNIDKLRAPWDDTENKELSAEDARKRSEDLTKAASLLKAYNDRFVELEKLLSLLPAEVRKIPNEFMSIDVNGFYRTVSISLGLNKYLDEISTDKEAFKIFNTAEEQNNALNNVMDVIDFLSKLDESDEELFESEDEDAPDGDQQDGTEDAPNGDKEDAPTDADKEAPNDDQLDDNKEAPTDDQHEHDAENAPVDDTVDDEQHDADNGQQNDAENAPVDDVDNGQQAGVKETPAANTADTNKGQQKADKPKSTGVAVFDGLFANNTTEFLD